MRPSHTTQLRAIQGCTPGLSPPGLHHTHHREGECTPQQNPDPQPACLPATFCPKLQMLSWFREMLLINRATSKGTSPQMSEFHGFVSFPKVRKAPHMSPQSRENARFSSHEHMALGSTSKIPSKYMPPQTHDSEETHERWRYRTG